jgi:hypothetical protein
VFFFSEKDTKTAINGLFSQFAGKKSPNRRFFRILCAERNKLLEPEAAYEGVYTGSNGMKFDPDRAGQRVSFSSLVHCSLFIVHFLTPPPPPTNIK